MNNFERPLTAFEEKLTAYLDGRLAPGEAEAFEREHPDALAEKAAATALGDALRLHSPAPPLRNGEFFNRQILREIAPPSAGAAAPARPPLWKLWRLAFAGACCALGALGIYKAAVAPDTLQTKYFAEVLSVRAGDAQLTARVVTGDDITVVWVDGFDKLPGDYVLE